MATVLGVFEPINNISLSVCFVVACSQGMTASFYVLVGGWGLCKHIYSCIINSLMASYDLML